MTKLHWQATIVLIHYHTSVLSMKVSTYMEILRLRFNKEPVSGVRVYATVQFEATSY